MKRILVIVFTCCYVLAIAQKPLTSKQIDSLVAKTMSVMPLAAISVAVIKDGKVIHSKGYGVNSIVTKEKTDDNTLFAIASNSKAFTATALGMLVDEGKLKWQDQVIKYIPEFKMYDPWVTENFTILDLLTHRSGLGLGAGDLMFFPDGANFTIKDILNSFQYQEPVSQFRTKYDYDNLLYMVAGEVVKRVSGMPWTEFIEKRIMAPLGMKRSAGIYANMKDQKNIALPHSVVKNQLTQITPYAESDPSMAAAGGILSSVVDLSQWVAMHMKEGKYGDNKQLISIESHRELWRPHTNISFRVNGDKRYNNHFEAYGLGFDILDRNGYIELSHTGGLPGMLSKIAMIPELNVGVIVLTDTDPGGYSFLSITQAIVDSYLGLKPDDHISNAQRYIQSNSGTSDSVTTAAWNITKAAKFTGDPKAYVGTYRDNWFGDINVTLKGDQLWMTAARSPKLNGSMHYYKGNTFAVKWDYQEMPADAFAIFSLDEEGKAIGIKMKAISPNTDFSFDFHDLDLKRISK
jgi:CubicO group peptidase (beta-lactamase class C family)